MTPSIRYDRDISMKTRDGVTLRANIYRPDDRERHPVILVRTPYNKNNGDSDFLRAITAASAGYVFVIQDTRGRFTSEGEFSPMMPDGQDGYDAVEWVASEPWSDGQVGMAGGSYLAHTQWWAALENPPHLRAIAPAISRGGPIREPRLSGVVELDFTVGWFMNVAIDMLDKLQKQGKDVSKQKQMLASANSLELDNYLPLKSIPHFQFEGLPEGYWLKTAEGLPLGTKTEKDLFWDYSKVKVPCFHSGGWYDIFTIGLFTNFLGMREHSGSEQARKGQHMIAGPWVHDGALSAAVGGLGFGPHASAIGSFIQQRHITFFDRYLRGIEGRPIPAVRYFVMGPNRWRNGDGWPLPQTEWQRFFLRSKGKANTAAGDGGLSPDPPAGEPPDRYIYDPLSPVPTLGGRVGANLPRGPIDQTNIEKRPDVLCYTTSELKEPLEVTGPIKMHLFAATSVPDTDFMAKLVDVYPDGQAYNIAEGCIRTRYRRSVIHPEFLVPGEVYEYIIDLAHTSIVFAKGHHLRIDVTSSNFPKIDRNMNTGNEVGSDAEGIPALQTIFHDSQYASYIDLPVIPIRLISGIQ